MKLILNLKMHMYLSLFTKVLMSNIYQVEILITLDGYLRAYVVGENTYENVNISKKLILHEELNNIDNENSNTTIEKWFIAHLTALNYPKVRILKKTEIDKEN